MVQWWENGKVEHSVSTVRNCRHMPALPKTTEKYKNLPLKTLLYCSIVTQKDNGKT